MGARLTLKGNIIRPHPEFRIPAKAMRRRHFLMGSLAAFTYESLRRSSHADSASMPDGSPEKIRLIPDMWHIHNVGRLGDGRLYFVDGQLDPAQGITKDFVCTFVFNQDGGLVEHRIELIGARGSYPEGQVGKVMSQHLAALDKRMRTDIWVRPFSVASHGTIFGLIPRQTEDGGWLVEFMPGNTLSFYPPWWEGGYDT